MKNLINNVKFIALVLFTLVLIGCASNSDQTKNIEDKLPQNTKVVKNFDELTKLVQTNEYNFTVYYYIHKDYSDKTLIEEHEGIVTKDNINQTVKNPYIHNFSKASSIDKDNITFSGENGLNAGPAKISYIHHFNYDIKPSGKVIIYGSDETRLPTEGIDETNHKYSLVGSLNKSVFVAYKKK